VSDGRSLSLATTRQQFDPLNLQEYIQRAGWSSPVARWAHNPKVVGSNPTPATKNILIIEGLGDGDSRAFSLYGDKPSFTGTFSVRWSLDT
jgi:hypothetical protein